MKHVKKNNVMIVLDVKLKKKKHIFVLEIRFYVFWFASKLVSSTNMGISASWETENKSQVSQFIPHLFLIEIWPEKSLSCDISFITS